MGMNMIIGEVMMNGVKLEFYLFDIL